MSERTYSTPERHAHQPGTCKRCGRQHLLRWERQTQCPTTWTLEDEWCPNTACLFAEFQDAQAGIDLAHWEGRQKLRELQGIYEERAEESSRPRPALYTCIELS